MFWSNAYTKFLESEVKRLQEENRVLVSAMLERAGHREAAHMLRGDNPEAQAAAIKSAPNPEQSMRFPDGARSWRSQAAYLSEQTRPKVYESSGKALEAKVKEQSQ